jgi:hypothetical protein
MTDRRLPDPDPEGVVTLPVPLLREVVERLAGPAEAATAMAELLAAAPPKPAPTGHSKTSHKRGSR